MSTQNAGVRYAVKRMPLTTGKQRVVMFALEHPSVLRAFIRTRQSSTVLLTRIRGMDAAVKNALMQLEKIGDSVDY